MVGKDIAFVVIVVSVIERGGYSISDCNCGFSVALYSSISFYFIDFEAVLLVA